jgi:hypothetical protein
VLIAKDFGNFPVHRRSLHFQKVARACEQTASSEGVLAMATPLPDRPDLD